MSQNEEKLFMLMAHAEDLQKLAQASLQKVGQAVSHLENASVKAISGAVATEIDRTLENTKKELLEANKGLVGASAEAQATCALMKRTGLFQAVFLLAVALIIAGASFGGLNWFVKSRLSELAELKAAIQVETATLADLQSKTWGLELVDYGKEGRGIVLPKGVKVDRTGELADKSGRIGIVIKP